MYFCPGEGDMSSCVDNSHRIVTWFPFLEGGSDWEEGRVLCEESVQMALLLFGERCFT